MWNIFKFLDIYYNQEPNQIIEKGSQSQLESKDYIILILISTIIILIAIIIDLKIKNRNKE